MKLLPKQLNISDKTYNFDSSNQYQKYIYRDMSDKIDELQELKLKLQSVTDVKERSKLTTAITKGVGVLEYFQSRYERYNSVEDVSREDYEAVTSPHTLTEQ